MNWSYYVNGVEQTFWRRIYPTKTFKAVSGILTAVATGVVTGKVTWREGAAAAAAGASIIVLRAIASKIELSNAALNPDLVNVVAAPK